MKKMRLCKFLPAVILFILLFINPGIHVYLHALFPSDILKTDSPIPRQLIQDETSVIPPTTNPTFDIIVNFFTKIYYQIPPFYREHRASIWIIFLSLLFLIMVISSIHNFYKRKILEKDLKKEYQKIEHRVKERTLKLKLTQEHLQDEIDRLKETERNLKQIKKAIETMKLGVTLSDTTGKIIYTNPANAQMHGYDSEELIGKYTSIFTSNVLREEIDLSKVKEWQGKIRKSSNIRKDGQIFPVQLISDLVRNEKGEIIAIVTTCEDITRRSLDEEALRTSEENYRRIFDNIQDIYYEVNIDGIIQEISPSVITISSYTREELLGKPISDIYANAKQRDNFLKALKKEEKVHDYEILIKGKGDAPPIPCSVTAKLILDESGLPLKIIGSMRNVLARKKAEEKQAQTLKDLQLANKELRDFAYVTSHDLKSPLRAINTLANWISVDYADKFDEKTKEQMHLLLGRVERMHQLIEGIFQYSSLGSYLGKKEDVDLNSLINNILKNLAPPEGIKIDLTDDLPIVYYEKERIIQIFEHLIKNAITFMKKPKGKVSISCQETEEEWVFSVKDTGPGIEKKYHDQIFEMFKTLQSRDEIETSGMGLTIVKKIVEMNEGRIWIDSRVGEGTAIFFTIPKLGKHKATS